MPIKTIKEQKRMILEASGPLTVEQSGELLEGLGRVLKGPGKTIELDLSGVTDADISCLQLLCSAQKSAVAKGKTLSVIKLSSIISQSATDAGFRDHNDCGRDNCPACMWAMPAGKDQA